MIFTIPDNSMMNLELRKGLKVSVEFSKEFVTGDIVLAVRKGRKLVRRFIAEDKPPWVYLKAENEKYKVILFDDETEMVGKVTFQQNIKSKK